MRAPIRSVFLAATLLGCGAKTGLLVPDVETTDDRPDVLDVFDAPDVRDVPDVPDVCAPRPLPVERFSAEVIFVIDRSGSMAELTRSGITRWAALTTAVTRVLPAVDSELSVGLIQFPGLITTDNQCGDNSRLTFTPRIMNASNVLDALRRTTPTGGTPTFEALQAAANYYRTNPPTGRVRGRYLVLATDGGPNCNSLISASTCVCTSPRGCAGFRGNLSCLDDDRTVELLTRLAGDGVPTFVIGVPGDDLMSLPRTLERMAVAGGRPHTAPGEPAYYRAEDVDEFTAAFRSITTALVRCRYVTNPVADPSRVGLRVGGRDVANDPTHTDGWDWGNRQAGEVVLYGAACEATQRPDGVVSLRYDCAE